MVESEFFQHSRVHWDFFSDPQLDHETWGRFAARYSEWINRPAGQSPIGHQIHQIWIGGSLPHAYKDWQNSWTNLNPNFSIHVWSEEEILDLGLKNERVFRSAQNPAVKSDIARYEILLRFGGIYIDTDFECIRPISDLVSACSLIVGTVFSSKPQVNNAFIAATAGHMVMDEMVRRIHSADVPLEKHVTDFRKIFRTTGPDALTAVVTRFLGEDPGICVLPSNYLYPWPSFLRDRVEDRYLFTTEQTHAIHHWEVSWDKRSSLRVGIGEALRHYRKQRSRGPRVEAPGT